MLLARYQENFMKLVILMISLFLPIFGHATFIPSPLISCNSSKAFNAGYSFTVQEAANGHYFGKLSQLTYGDSQSLGEERINITVNKEDGVCRLEITQSNDRDRNGLNLKIRASNAGGRNTGKLNIKIDGRPINSLFKDMNCYIDQMTLNKLCEPNFNGGIYQQNSGTR